MLDECGWWTPYLVSVALTALSISRSSVLDQVSTPNEYIILGIAQMLTAVKYALELSPVFIRSLSLAYSLSLNIFFIAEVLISKAWLIPKYL